MKIQCILFSFVLAIFAHGAVKAEIPTNGKLDDDIVTLVYDSNDGGFYFRNGTAGPIAEFDIRSESGILGPLQNEAWCSTVVFNCESDQHYYARLGVGARDLFLGYLEPTYTAEFLGNDLTVTGSITYGGSGFPADLLVVPEPDLKTMMLICACFLTQMSRQFRT